MSCLGLEPGAARWKAQTTTLSYGGTPTSVPLFLKPRFSYQDITSSAFAYELACTYFMTPVTSHY